MTAGAVALVLSGAVLWSFGEYVLHRFVMHERRGRGLASREHLRHHAERDSILESWYLAWTGVLVVGGLLALAATLAVGPGRCRGRCRLGGRLRLL